MEDETQDIHLSNDYAKSAFHAHLKGRKELISSYGLYLFFSFLGNCCCCFKTSLANNGYLRKSARRYYKFRLALDRLAGEKDIRRILYMNRINELIHKSIFMSRQRKAINYGNRYVISDRQLEESHRRSRSRKNSKTHSRDREGR